MKLGNFKFFFICLLLILTNNMPSNNPIKFKWQKKHEENLTGTTKAHKPEGSLAFDSTKNMKKYETWKF